MIAPTPVPVEYHEKFIECMDFWKPNTTAPFIEPAHPTVTQPISIIMNPVCWKLLGTKVRATNMIMYPRK